MTSWLVGRRVEEQLRRSSYLITERVARRYGSHLGMYVGCGFPKSGTVWLCRMMSTYLDAPHPRQYVMPIAMRAVVHAHWSYHRGLPATAYIHRDGRDVMVSLLTHYLRQITIQRSPRRAAKLEHRFRELFGRSFDARHAMSDLGAHLPDFIDAEFRDPIGGTTWSAHVRDWLDEPHENVAPVSYEALKANTIGAFSDLITRLIGRPADRRLVELSVARNDFTLTSGRQPGAERMDDPLRKGIVGDWRNHFTRETAEVFHRYAGHELVMLGYEPDRSWVAEIGA